MVATNPAFSAVIFDCDGVMVDSERIYLEVEMHHLAEIGLHFSRHEYQQTFNGLRPRDFILEVAATYEKLGKGPLPESFGPDLASEAYARMEADLQAIDGIHALLDRLPDSPKAVASSSSAPRLFRKLELTNLTSYFGEHIYSGDFVENGKPAPDLFLYSAEKLGVDPAGCLVIEDSVNGVLAGVAAGMDVWGFTGGGHADEALGHRLKAAGASRVFDSHHAMAAALA